MHLPQRPHTASRVGAPAVVLEANQPHSVARANIGRNRNIADQAHIAADGVDIQRANAGQFFAGVRQEIVPE